MIGTRIYCVVQIFVSTSFFSCTVRVIKSWRAGVGKSLFKKRLTQELHKLIPSASEDHPNSLTISLHEKRLNTDEVMNVLLQCMLPPEMNVPRIFHFDISHEVCRSKEN